ncbi:LIM domain-binding protein 1-like isoform X2 [Girardinichthys multiradiatus]|uniref:LIM domain-binding protein 1-like isoform X2 n=1 Tax=Girardinichthys multiradiatus TaxID=208333 RepID=UPI001FAC7E67|nr:LIM domain-binding protein 1-like isoform X2 [Girardinichthys multiradiatus]
MIIIFLLSCVTIIVTAVPVSPNVHPLHQPQKGVSHRGQPVEATIKSEAQTAPLPLSLEQPQPGNPLQPDQQTNPQQSLQQHALVPQGGSTMMFPIPQGVGGFLPPNQLTLAQQPLIFPSYGFLPVFPSPYSNQLVSESPIPQTPTNQLTNSPVPPVENAAGAAAPSGAGARQIQQQNPPIVYMLQQPMNPSLGGLSSEELETAAKMSQLGMYMPTMLANLPAGAGAVQAQSQAAGLTNPDQWAARQTAGTSATGVQPSQGLPCAGSQLNADSLPAGLKRAVPEAPTVQTPAQPKLLPRQRNLA